MKSKKKVRLFFLTMVLSILAIPVLNNQILAKESAKSKPYNPKHLVAKLKKENIYLYYDKKDKSGMLKGFYLKSGKKIKYFNWINIDKDTFYPEIHLIDDKYIAITCTTGEGTGINLQELYLVNRNNLKVILYENPVNVIKSNVKFNYKAPDISILIGDKKWSTSSKYDGEYYEEPYYENRIVYEFDAVFSFVASLSLYTSNASFLGDFKIRYSYDNKQQKFIPNEINFCFESTPLKN